MTSTSQTTVNNANQQHEPGNGRLLPRIPLVKLSSHPIALLPFLPHPPLFPTKGSRPSLQSESSSLARSRRSGLSHPHLSPRTVTITITNRHQEHPHPSLNLRTRCQPHRTSSCPPGRLRLILISNTSRSPSSPLTTDSHRKPLASLASWLTCLAIST